MSLPIDRGRDDELIKPGLIPTSHPKQTFPHMMFLLKKAYFYSEALLTH